jgi:Uma2 family endonuclease
VWGAAKWHHTAQTDTEEEDAVTTQTVTPHAPTAALTQAGPIEIITDRASFVIPPGVHQLDRFRQWVTSDDFPEKIRTYFNQGAVCIDISQEEIENHNKVKTEITSSLHVLNRELDAGEVYSDGVLVTNVAADVSNNPDAIFVRWESFDEGRVHKVARRDSPGEFVELEGVPDWVLEIVSKYSGKKDTQELREAYHRAGIPEYWLIDARKEQIDFQILQHRKSKYFAAKRKDGWQWSGVFGRWFRLERTRGRQQAWRYRLEMRGE